jgi:hypothetical protein
MRGGPGTIFRPLACGPDANSENLDSLPSGSGRSQPFAARKPGGRGVAAFALTPSGDHLELRVLDASDLPAVLEEGGDVLLAEPARPWERGVLVETHQPIPAGRAKHSVDGADHLLHLLVGEHVQQPAVGDGVERLPQRSELQCIALDETGRQSPSAGFRLRLGYRDGGRVKACLTGPPAKPRHSLIRQWLPSVRFVAALSGFAPVRFLPSFTPPSYLTCPFFIFRIRIQNTEVRRTPSSKPQTPNSKYRIQISNPSRERRTANGEHSGQRPCSAHGSEGHKTPEF